MWRKIQEVHPTLAEVGKFIDWKMRSAWPVAIRDADGVQEVSL